MASKKIITHITPGDGNIFTDLGFDPYEAKNLLTEADSAISQKLAIKDSLIAELVRWIETQSLSPTEAAKILGVTSPRVADVISMKSTNFTIEALVDMLLKAGKHIRVSVQ